ncbi:transposase [Nocardia brasiliensis]|uniref:transposase n=1 Tax=Nocardia brasiliensis TaxID=37326 RepID=UPI00245861CA|nr:transposase [Nocardia brasiliensis]
MSRPYRVVNSEIRRAAVEQMWAMLASNPGMSRNSAASSIAAEIGVHRNSILNWMTEAEEATPPAGDLTRAELLAQNALLLEQLATSRQINRTLSDRLHELAPEA